jgi:tetratricopeptide (TPR) repeat protein
LRSAGSATAEQPLILVFEDLHWVDPSTLDVVSSLARRREAAKLLLLSTYRPGDAALSRSPLEGLVRDLDVHRLCEEIAVDRLEEADVAQYLAAEFKVSSLPSDFSNIVYRHSGGNALFMVAIVRSMVDKGLIVQEEGEWRLTSRLEATEFDVPETLQRMLEVQLERLSEPEQRVLKSASAVGERFSVRAITSTLDAAPDHIEDLCEGLVDRQQFIRAIGIQDLPDGSVSAHYEFKHALYRQAIYRRLSDVSRSRFHAVIGQQLRKLFNSSGREREIAAELALHFELGREYQLAVRYLLMAAENAAGRFAYRDAIQILQHALKLASKVASTVGGDLETQILELLGDAYYALGSMAESAKAYESGAALAVQNGIKAAQVSALTSLMRPYGLIDPDRGIAAIDEATQVCRGLGDPLLLAQTQMLAGASRLLYDKWSDADAELIESAHQTIRDYGDADTPPYHQMLRAYVQALQGRYREALETFESFTNKIDASTSLMTYLFALTGKAVALLYLGQFGDVLRVVREGRETAEKNGNDPWLFNFREAWLRTLAFDFDGARRVCESITRSGAEYPTGQPETIARIAGAYAELERGNYDHAIEYFRQVIDPQITPKFFLHWFWRLNARLGLSRVWLEAGDIAKAGAEADVFLESARSTPNPFLQTLAWEMKSRIAIADEDWTRARDHVDQAFAVLEKFDVPVAAWRVHATAWDLLLHAKDSNAAETHRARAEAYVLAIANSFAPDEPLRKTFLEAAPVRRILKPRQGTMRSGLAAKG